MCKRGAAAWQVGETPGRHTLTASPGNWKFKSSAASELSQAIRDALAGQRYSPADRRR
jgi:hypothetical protein